jgi:hypothetical protein
MVAADIDGSKIFTFGPRSGLLGLLGGVVVPPTGFRVNDCAAVPLQVYCCS